MSYPVTFSVTYLDYQKYYWTDVPVVFRDEWHYSCLEDDYFYDIFHDILEWINKHVSPSASEIEECEPVKFEIDDELDLESIIVS